MSFYAADVNGYIDDVASIGGLDAFYTAAEAHPGPIASFAETGETTDPQGLAAALRSVTFSDPSADDVRKQVLACALIAESVLIVSDGTSDEEPDGAVVEPPPAPVVQTYRDRIEALLHPDFNAEMAHERDLRLHENTAYRQKIRGLIQNLDTDSPAGTERDNSAISVKAWESRHRSEGGASAEARATALTPKHATGVDSESLSGNNINVALRITLEDDSVKVFKPLYGERFHAPGGGEDEDDIVGDYESYRRAEIDRQAGEAMKEFVDELRDRHTEVQEIWTEMQAEKDNPYGDVGGHPELPGLEGVRAGGEKLPQVPLKDLFEDIDTTAPLTDDERAAIRERLEGTGGPARFYRGDAADIFSEADNFQAKNVQSYDAWKQAHSRYADSGRGGDDEHAPLIREGVSNTDASLAEREVLAWGMSQELGFFGLVPETHMASVTLRSGAPTVGMMQEFVESTGDYFHVAPRSELARMGIFDAVIGNLDRHSGNYLVTPSHHLVAIDHGYAFGNSPLPDDALRSPADRERRERGEIPPPKSLRGVPELRSFALQIRDGDLSLAEQRAIAARIDTLDWKKFYAGSHLDKQERATLKDRAMVVANYLRAGQAHHIDDVFVADHS